MPFASAARVFLVGVGVSMAPLVSAAAAGTANLVDEGRRLFFTETFAGNGRTCGSCHPADNNYTIDAAYIARLPKSDPLLVADFLDDPVLLRKLGMVTVHADGFGRPGVQRGVPTLLGLARSLVPDFGAVGDRIDAVGWSGDGVPDGGSLRDFATGAVREHLAKSPARVEGMDFRLPTRDELRALEKFMLSLGRGVADELELGNFIGVTFRSPLVEDGRRLFNAEESGPCALCHNNATALNGDQLNGMFEIGVQRRRNTPAHRLDPDLPADGGFGPCAPGAPVPSRRLRGWAVQHAVPDRGGGHHALVPRQFRGDDRGRGPVLHHADLRQLDRGPDAQHPPDESDIIAIAALLRTLNAIENIRSSNAFVEPGAGPAPRCRPATAAAGGRRHERRDRRAQERPATALRRPRPP